MFFFVACSVDSHLVICNVWDLDTWKAFTLRILEKWLVLLAGCCPFEVETHLESFLCLCSQIWVLISGYFAWVGKACSKAPKSKCCYNISMLLGDFCEF